MRPLLAVLCLLLAHLMYVGEGYECGHIPPERVGYAATTSSRTRRQATERQPIRIVPVFYEGDFNQLSPELNNKYKSVVNKSIDYLSSFLKVDRLTENILLQRFCNTSEELKALNPFDHCTQDGPCRATFCASPEFPIPEEHLKACKTCETFGSTNCSTEGQDGPGVPNADFIVYVAARDSLCSKNALASATHCFHDKRTDRPVAGTVNLCSNLANEQDIDNIVLTVVHELTHALVFSFRLLAFYRDENGNPRTPRNETTGLPSFRVFNNIFLPSADTVIPETVKREALNGVFDIDTLKVVTPAVLREARSHFGCPTLNGLELENLGGLGTAFSHWKKRLVENEGMTGVISTNGVFSRLTFALYEDSGWYDVDYNVASPLRFGQCLGCDFAEQSCFSFGLDREPFCNKFVLGINSSCTFDRLAVARCDLTDFSNLNQTVAEQFQYFPDPNFGGRLELNDFCPINAGMNIGHCQRQRDLGNNVLLQSLGSKSKCLDFELRTNFQISNVTFPPIYGGACYEVSCASEGSVAITVGQNTIICQSAGQEVIVEAEEFNIIIICPAFEDICWENSTTCPTTTSAPPSGLSQGGDIAIGIVFGLVFPLVAIAVVVVVAMVIMYKRRLGKSYLRRSEDPDNTRGSYKLVGEGFLEKET